MLFRPVKAPAADLPVHACTAFITMYKGRTMHTYDVGVLGLLNQEVVPAQGPADVCWHALLH